MEVSTPVDKTSILQALWTSDGSELAPESQSLWQRLTGQTQEEVAQPWGWLAAVHPIKVKFSQSDCKVCPSRLLCTGTTRRSMTLHPKEQMQALFAARQREETDEFKDTYRHRAGIEGTHSQGVRTMGLRRSRYIGLRKTHLGHVAIAAAINIVQLMSWLRGEAPEQTRTSPFKRAMEQTA